MASLEQSSSLPVLDQHRRPLGNLRLSVTDRCNLRCTYCMPEEHYKWLPKQRLLSFEEICTLVEAFCDVGIDRVRLTGGEPLLRRDLDSLVAMLASNSRLRDLALTTNGVLLESQAVALRKAGLHRVTISLDSLQHERFAKIAQRDDLDVVLRGIEAASAAGFESVKIDTVVMRGTNDDELEALLDYGKRVGAEVRFIEYMDVGGATRWEMEHVMTRAQMLEQLKSSCGAIEPIRESNSAPADRFRLADGTVFGIISSTTQPFCGSCDRSRVTADGHWFRCLYAREGTNLRTPLRAGASREELAKLLRETWSQRTDRGAEDRLREADRQALAAADELARDPHLEMHTRGG